MAKQRKGGSKAKVEVNGRKAVRLLGGRNSRVSSLIKASSGQDELLNALCRTLPREKTDSRAVLPHFSKATLQILKSLSHSLSYLSILNSLFEVDSLVYDIIDSLTEKMRILFSFSLPRSVFLSLSR